MRNEFFTYRVSTIHSLQTAYSRISMLLSLLLPHSYREMKCAFSEALINALHSDIGEDHPVYIQLRIIKRNWLVIRIQGYQKSNISLGSIRSFRRKLLNPDHLNDHSVMVRTVNRQGRKNLLFATKLDLREGSGKTYMEYPDLNIEVTAEELSYII